MNSSEQQQLKPEAISAIADSGVVSLSLEFILFALQLNLNLLIYNKERFPPETAMHLKHEVTGIIFILHRKQVIT